MSAEGGLERGDDVNTPDLNNQAAAEGNLDVESLGFRPPQWYIEEYGYGLTSFPGNICMQHDVCIYLEYDIRVRRRRLLLQEHPELLTAELVERVAEEEKQISEANEIQAIKRNEALQKLLSEMEKKQKEVDDHMANKKEEDDDMTNKKVDKVDHDMSNKKEEKDVVERYKEKGKELEEGNSDYLHKEEEEDNGFGYYDKHKEVDDEGLRKKNKEVEQQDVAKEHQVEECCISSNNNEDGDKVNETNKVLDCFTEDTNDLSGNHKVKSNNDFFVDNEEELNYKRKRSIEEEDQTEELKGITFKKMRLAEAYCCPSDFNEEDNDVIPEAGGEKGNLFQFKQDTIPGPQETDKNSEETKDEETKNDNKDGLPELVEEVYKEWTVEPDDKHDLYQLLFSGTNSNFLIDSGRNKCYIDRLKDKFVILFFVSLPSYGEACPSRFKPRPEFKYELVNLYHLHKEELEIVLVALGDNEIFFDQVFSKMCWLAIPHEREEDRMFFRDLFFIPDKRQERAVLFDNSGVVISTDVAADIRSFGIQCFPFTRKVREEFLKGIDALRHKIFKEKNVDIPTFTDILGEHVISFSSGAKKVPISELEGKTLVLYFFEPTVDGIKLAKNLMTVWDSLEVEQRDAFKIVVINKSPFNHHLAMKSLIKNLGFKIPWFMTTICGKKVCKIFGRRLAFSSTGVEREGDLIVFQPDRYQRLSYFALQILLKYGNDAYPFTLEAAVELEMKKQQQQLVISKLLSPDAPLGKFSSTIGCKEDFLETTVSELLGKPILLLFGTRSCFECGDIITSLEEMYRNKGTDDDFEIIYMSLDCHESTSSFLKSLQGRPWFCHAFHQHFSLVLSAKLFEVYPPQLPAIAVFGPDEHLVTKQTDLVLRRGLESKFPFIEANMGEEVKKELINRHKWDLETVVKKLLS